MFLCFFERNNYDVRHFISLFTSRWWTVEAPESQKILSRQHQDIMGCRVKLQASVSPSFHQSVGLISSSLYQSISPSDLKLFVSLSVHQSDCSSFYQSISQSVRHSLFHQSVCPSVHLCQSVSYSCISPLVRPSINPSVTPSVRPFISPSVRQSTSTPGAARLASLCGCKLHPPV